MANMATEKASVAHAKNILSSLINKGRRRQDTGRVGIARQTQSSLDQYRGPGKTRAPGKPCRRPAALFEYFVSSTGAAREDASPAEKVAPRLRGNSWIKCGDNATVESKICVKD